MKVPRVVADSLLNRTVQRIRYYRAGVPWYGQLLRLTIECLATLGLRIEPLHLFIEAGHSRQPPPLKGRVEDFAIEFLQASDMAALASIPGRNFSDEQLLLRLEEGKRCLGIRYRDQIVAFIWFNVNECTVENYTLFRLREHEAHLFDAYTTEAFRGRNLAPILRLRCCEELARLGRTRCYSVTAAFNTPSLRVKQKLGVQTMVPIIYVELLKRWRFHVLLRRLPRLTR